MSEAIRVHVRYDVPNEENRTRRERNADFGYPSPTLIVPTAGHHLWEWYFSLSDTLRRVRDGACWPIPPSEFVAWQQATRNIVYPREYAILAAMDVAYCSETNKELAAYRAREDDRREREARKGRRGRSNG